ncbi:MAG: MarR family transcriptional regulator [bacterium]
MSSAPVDDTDFGVLMNMAFGVFKSHLHEAMAHAGYDDLGPSFGYVFRILQPGSMSLRELSECIGISAQGTLKIVNDMVAKGYVERREDANDKRVTQLSLSTRGRAAIRTAKSFHARFERDIGARYGVKKVAAARSVLESIVEQAAADGLNPMVRPL